MGLWGLRSSRVRILGICARACWANNSRIVGQHGKQQRSMLSSHKFSRTYAL
ncbi:hypothetical protein CKA32_006647 [Geitlerinema sp. FC II]|nr:hypothetical protein CKA32_006647 [Geitlerinema sp. FC II]